MAGIGIDPNDGDFKYLLVDRKALMKSQVGGSFDSKKNVWAPHEKHGFLKAIVKSTKGDEVTVETEKHEVSPSIQII